MATKIGEGFQCPMPKCSGILLGTDELVVFRCNKCGSWITTGAPKQKPKEQDTIEWNGG